MKLRFIICFSLLWFVAPRHLEAQLKPQSELMATLNYSWNASFEAVSYEVEIKNTSTQEVYTQHTTNTIISFNDIPSGTYEIIVKAIKANGSSSIIIEDLSVL